MEEKIHPQYLKGFNQGYFLAKYKPKLIEQLISNSSKNEFFWGLEDGRQTFMQEHSHNQLKNLEHLNYTPKKLDKKQDLEH